MTETKVPKEESVYHLDLWGNLRDSCLASVNHPNIPNPTNKILSTFNPLIPQSKKRMGQQTGLAAWVGRIENGKDIFVKWGMWSGDLMALHLSVSKITAGLMKKSFLSHPQLSWCLMGWKGSSPTRQQRRTAHISGSHSSLCWRQDAEIDGPMVSSNITNPHFHSGQVPNIPQTTITVAFLGISPLSKTNSLGMRQREKSIGCFSLRSTACQERAMQGGQLSSGSPGGMPTLGLRESSSLCYVSLPATHSFKPQPYLPLSL